MAESIANRCGRKPAKPYPDFPLFPDASGRWAKKILGKLHYFGKTSDGWEPALQRYQDERDDLMAGRVPRARCDGLTMQDLVNKFLTAKLRQVEQGELQPATLHDYHKACAQITNSFGKTRVVEDLATDDFGALRSSLAKRLGAVGLSNAITRIKVAFKWAYDNGLLKQPARYGTEFKPPSARSRRLHRADKPVRIFSDQEIQAMLKAAAAVNLKAAILLGINCGFGNNDVAALPIDAIDLEAGVIEFVRPKTGMPCAWID